MCVYWYDWAGAGDLSPLPPVIILVGQLLAGCDGLLTRTRKSDVGSIPAARASGHLQSLQVALPLISALGVTEAQRIPTPLGPSSNLGGRAMVTTINDIASTIEQYAAEKVEASVVPLKAQISELTAERSGLKTQIANFQGEITTLRARITELEKPAPTTPPVKRTAFGIDVATTQSDIDFNRAKDDGVEFVIVKMGGLNVSPQYVAPAYVAQVDRARAAGLKIGHYYLIGKGKTPVQQADYFVNNLHDFRVNEDVLALDNEALDANGTKWTDAQAAEFIRRVIERTGIPASRVWHYAGASDYRAQGKWPQLEALAVRFWWAAYGSLPTGKTPDHEPSLQNSISHWDVHQFTDRTSVAGMSVDGNYSNIPVTELFAKGTVSPWKLGWEDDFSGFNNRDWTADVSTTYGHANGHEHVNTNRTKNLRVEGGILVLEAHRENPPLKPTSNKDPLIAKYPNGRPYSSAHIKTQGKKVFTLGVEPVRFAVRAKMPLGPGFLPCPLWLRPADGGDGEIDVVESETKNAVNVVQTVHQQYSPSVKSGKVVVLATPITEWHVYEVEVAPTYIQYYIDGKATHRVTSAQLPRFAELFGRKRDWFFHITHAVGGTWVGSPTAATPFPAKQEIDWIKVYNPT